MMYNGYMGMHLGWWAFIFVLVLVLGTFFFRSRRRSLYQPPYLDTSLSSFW